MNNTASYEASQLNQVRHSKHLNNRIFRCFLFKIEAQLPKCAADVIFGQLGE